MSGLPRSRVFRWFVFVVMFLLVAMEVIVAILRVAAILGSLAVIVTVVIYVICLLSLSIWYLVTAVRLLRFHFAACDAPHSTC